MKSAGVLRSEPPHHELLQVAPHLDRPPPGNCPHCLAPDLLRRRDVSTAAGLLKVAKRVDLAGHFELFAVDRIVPALDVDGAGVAVGAEDGEDVGPVAVAQAGVAILVIAAPGEDALGAQEVRVEGGVLAVHVEHFGCPLAELTDVAGDLLPPAAERADADVVRGWIVGGGGRVEHGGDIERFRNGLRVLKRRGRSKRGGT